MWPLDGGVQNGSAFYSQGHVDDKNAARAGQVAKIDFATVHSDGLSGDREAEAEAVMAGARSMRLRETLEDLREPVGRNSDAGVRDVNLGVVGGARE